MLKQLELTRLFCEQAAKWSIRRLRCACLPRSDLKDVPFEELPQTELATRPLTNPTDLLQAFVPRARVQGVDRHPLQGNERSVLPPARLVSQRRTAVPEGLQQLVALHSYCLLTSCKRGDWWFVRGWGKSKRGVWRAGSLRAHAPPLAAWLSYEERSREEQRIGDGIPVVTRASIGASSSTCLLKSVVCVRSKGLCAYELVCTPRQNAPVARCLMKTALQAG